MLAFSLLVFSIVIKPRKPMTLGIFSQQCILTVLSDSLQFLGNCVYLYVNTEIVWIQSQSYICGVLSTPDFQHSHVIASAWNVLFASFLNSHDSYSCQLDHVNIKAGLPLTFEFWKSRLPGCQFWKSREENLEVWYFEGWQMDDRTMFMCMEIIVLINLLRGK